MVFRARFRRNRISRTGNRTEWREREQITKQRFVKKLLWGSAGGVDGGGSVARNKTLQVNWGRVILLKKTFERHSSTGEKF